MGVTSTESAWHDLADQIISQWPILEAGHLVSVAGDRAAFARYLATTYDLSAREALDAVDNWLSPLICRGA